MMFMLLYSAASRSTAMAIHSYVSSLEKYKAKPAAISGNAASNLTDLAQLTHAMPRLGQLCKIDIIEWA